ncbi:Na+:solute symporter [Natronococcus pandeyae]|uniref:Na+:solute symporter n=1 Tax=Natronococcus pandeyae TaxID=2055836 RepID=A0A8J8TRA0_9EURY|nr:Na+:solute symporter [Natronococcus pandeyae]TYL37750.1 Na+:solute symporter [Natronococcus pandeyae]
MIVPSTTVPLQTWGEELGVEYYSPNALVLFVFFSLLMVAIGILAGRYQTDREEYFVAGRRGGVFVVALAMFASIQSGWGMIGVTGTGFVVGLEYMIIVAVGTPFGFVLSYWLLGRKMRMLGELRDAITVPDAMYYRFEDERVRLLGATAVLLGCMGYLAAQYAALGIVGALVLPVSFFEALLIGLAVVGFYTVVGGMLASIWSDAIQGVLMVFGAVLTAYYVIANYPGGTDAMITTISAEQPEFFNFTLLGMDGLGAIGFLLSVVVIQLTVAGQPHATTKFYMIRDVSLLRWGAFITAFAYMLTALYWVTAPFVRAAIFEGHVPDPGNPDAALPLALLEFAPDVVIAFVLVAIIAAIMSTSNAFLNMGASAVVHDYFLEHRGEEITDDQEVLYGRLTTLAILAVAGIIAATFPGLIFVLGAAGWAIFASVLFPCVAIAYNWRGATAEGALWGSAVGLALTLVMAYGVEYLGFSLPLGILGGQLAMVIGYAVFVGVSLVTSTNTYEDLDPDIQEVMDLGRVRGGTVSSPTVAADGGVDDSSENK